MTSQTPDPASASAETSSAKHPASSPGFGWTPYAELINGRFAMIGFIALLVIELWTGQGFLAWIGLR